MNAYVEGFLLQASLILALGAQNIFVLESGLKKQRHILVALVCSICDATLIAIGVLGAASLFVKIPTLKITFGIIGVLFLAFYAFKKLKESFNKTIVIEEESIELISAKKVVLLSLGFSLLNPHVYLDTIILVGGYSTKYEAFFDRLIFGFGAASFSTLWFFGLSLFAMLMSSILKNPKIMQYISLISGIILLLLSIKLGLDVYSWIIA